MSETSQLVTTLKRQLKAQGITYRDVAVALGVSEANVKRLFASGRFSVERLVEISRLLGFTLAEITQEAATSEPRLKRLSDVQERELVSDTTLLLVAVCALNHWLLDDIVAAYRLSEAECLQRLLRLDRLRLIDLLPGNRIRLNVARDFDWLANGPIEQYFQRRGRGEFLNHAFHHSGEVESFVHGMLTEQALGEMQTEVLRLRRRFAELHEQSLSAPLQKRRGTAMLLAMRAWEPPEFAALRRNATPKS